ncbi:tRNA1Val (adenine37-N6)-methyltransferase [Marinirhabdus gelatinilytica]|uniref:tRNA1(Val) (adenine(37)-N6)-methyltransferase n=2 Tax=Marinirhabdus gelatinilytica TaxID=1703343 RepID=A0A370QKJ5_9FLAO|nr:tRNA1Val (adenine37-N6)-methyltransferase [Marinirhabdus gelatinilytica]
MAHKPFQFKQFTVSQDRCAMKIGTDGVLLGAWVSLLNNPESILDIGAGTGVISLQLSQRSLAQTIDAIEIDEDAYEQCTENFENSPWADRLFCYHASIQEFVSEIDERYDLIVSNPPFHAPLSGEMSKAEGDNTIPENRKVARFTDSLPFQHLIVSVAHLLSTHGTFAVILPKNEEEKFVEMAEHYELFPKRICRVKGSPTSEVKRSLMEFTFQQQKPSIETLTIETQRHVYTKEYIELMQDFYLKM